MGLKYIAFLAATILLLMAQSDTAFAQSKKKDKGKNKDKTTTSTKAETNNPNHEKIEKLLFDGILAKTKDNFTGAIDAYKECLKIDPTNDVAMYELARLYYEGNNSDQALAFAKDAANLAPDNKWYQYLYAEVLALGGKFNDVPVLTLYRINGEVEKGWEGKPLWIPNIKLPLGKNFWRVI